MEKNTRYFLKHSSLSIYVRDLLTRLIGSFRAFSDGRVRTIKRSSGVLNTLRFILVLCLTTLSFAQGSAQNAMPLPAFGSTYTGNVRGYWFTAPTSFIITGVRVPADAGTGTQNIHIIKINDPTPVVFATTSTNFTTLAYIQGAPNNVIQNVNILVNAGDIIGVLGQAGTVNSYSVNTPFTSNIFGQPIQLTRLLYQGNITGGPAPNYSTEPSSNQIARVELYYDSPTPCSGQVVAGSAVSSETSACASSPFNLSLNGATIGGGVTYQWQSSPAGANN